MTTPTLCAQQMGSFDRKLGSSPAVVVVTIVSVFSVLFIFYQATWLSTQHVPTRSTRARSDVNRELGRTRGVISNQDAIKPGSIFFIDSSTDIQSPFTFDLSSACAVESTAIHNPTRQIQFLVFGNRSINFNHPLTKMVINLPTVDIMVISIENFTLGSTPYQGSFVTQAVSDYFYNHKTSKEVRLKLRRYLGDALRALLLWRYGGIYLDQDIITLKGLDGFKNAAGCRVLLERGNLVPPVAVNCLRVNFGVIALDQGHRLAGYLVKNFAEKEVFEDTPPNGNTDLNRLLHNLCGRFKLFQALVPVDSALAEKKTLQFVDSHVSPDFAYSSSCLASLNFSILDTKVFYPLPPSEVGYYFDPKFTPRVIWWINSSDSYLVHYFETQAYKYFNSTWDIPRESAYGVLAKGNCPKTFDIGFPNMPA